MQDLTQSGLFREKKKNWRYPRFSHCLNRNPERFSDYSVLIWRHRWSPAHVTEHIFSRLLPGELGMKSEITYFNLLYQIKPYITKSKLNNNEFINKHAFSEAMHNALPTKRKLTLKWRHVLCNSNSSIFSLFLTNVTWCLNNNSTIFNLSHTLPILHQ